MTYYRVTLEDGVRHYFTASSAKALRSRIARDYPAFAVASVRKVCDADRLPA